MPDYLEADNSIPKRNAAVSGRYLVEYENIGYKKPILGTDLESIGEMSFIRIKGVTDFWKKKEIDDPGVFLRQLIDGLAMANSVYAFILSGDENGIDIRMGISEYCASSLYDGIKALYTGIEVEYSDISDIRRFANGYGGAVVGTPSIPAKKEEETSIDRISTLAKAMLGTEFIYVVLARGIRPQTANSAHDRLLQSMKAANAQIKKSVTGGSMGNQSLQLVDFAAQEYSTNLRLLERVIQEGCNTGLWRGCTYFAVKEKENHQRMSNAIKMVFGGTESKPDRLRCINIPNIGSILCQLRMLAIRVPDDVKMYHPLCAWKDSKDVVHNLYVNMFQSIMSGTQLSTMVGLPMTEMPGFYIDAYVEFDTAARKDPPEKDALVLGEIMNAGRADNTEIANPYCFDVTDLNRHGLIIGITGGGKTNTTKYLLGNIWNQHRKPFLVIESAKREYWELMNLQGFQDMMLFTLGSEEPGRSIRYRINPFEVVGTVSLQTHIDYLLSTFKAAFELFPPMPYVLETSVYEVYKDRGWDIVTNSNTLGMKDYPTLTDLIRKIDIVTDGLGYHNETKENTKAALKARINSLRIGGKGAMMDTRHSVPIEKLLSGPAVLELEDLGDDDTKAFVIGMLLVQLYEYRKSTHHSGQSKLVHLMMIEEAHRLLKHVPEGGEGGNTRAKSVEFFCNLLAEIRSFGQGFLIADQIPTKLASDTLKNTNLKIVHRIVMEEDRQAIGRAMNMNDEQIDYLSSLRRGYAAVYAEGDNRPKLVHVPLVKNDNAKNRGEVLKIIQNTVNSKIGDYATAYDYHYGCTYCEEQCKWYKMVKDLPAFKDDVKIQKYADKNKDNKYGLRYLAGTVKSIISPNDTTSYYQQVCILGYFLEKTDLSDSDKAKVMANFVRNWRHKDGIQ